MVVKAARSSKVVKLALNILLASLHALFGKLLLRSNLNARCLGQWHVEMGLRLLQLMFLLLNLLSLMLLLLLLIILIGLISLLPLLELI